jgi:hypothetical protein
LSLPPTKRPFVQLDQPPLADLSAMAITVATGHEVSVTSIARRRAVLLRVIDPNTPVSVVALLGTRYFITVVTFTHISGLTVFVTRMRLQPFKRRSSLPACVGLEVDLRAHTKSREVRLRERASGVFKGIVLFLRCRVRIVRGEVEPRKGRYHQSACPT